MRRALAALTVASMLVLAGCASQDEGGDDATTTTGELADITVEGDADAAPTATFDAPFTVGETSSEVVTEGDGEVLELGQDVVLDYVAYNGNDADEPFESTYESGTQTLRLDEQQSLPGLVRGLEGVTVGSRVLIAITAADGYGPAGGLEERGIGAEDSLVVVADVRSVLPTEASGTAVEPPAGLPTVTFDDNGVPTITAPETDPPAETVAQPLIEGEGPAVESGQTITVNYAGVKWEGSEPFDSSYERGAPASFPIGVGGVIPAWDETLVGVPVGSRILMVVPPDAGYGVDGNPEGGIAGTDTLVFVIDILGAS